MPGHARHESNEPWPIVPVGDHGWVPKLWSPDAGEVKVRVSRLAEAKQHDAMSVAMEPCPASDLTQAEALDINQLARM